MYVIVYLGANIKSVMVVHETPDRVQVLRAREIRARVVAAFVVARVLPGINKECFRVFPELDFTPVPKSTESRRSPSMVGAKYFW